MLFLTCIASSTPLTCIALGWCQTVRLPVAAEFTTCRVQCYLPSELRISEPMIYRGSDGRDYVLLSQPSVDATVPVQLQMLRSHITKTQSHAADVRPDMPQRFVQLWHVSYLVQAHPPSTISSFPTLSTIGRRVLV